MARRTPRRPRGDLLVTWAACCMCGSLFMRLGKQWSRIACSDECQHTRELATQRVRQRLLMKTDPEYRKKQIAATVRGLRRRRQADPEKFNAYHREYDRRRNQDPEYRRRRNARANRSYHNRLATDPAKRARILVQQREWRRRKLQADPAYFQAATRRGGARRTQRRRTDPEYRATQSKRRRAYERRRLTAEAGLTAVAAMQQIRVVLSQITKGAEHAD